MLLDHTARIYGHMNTPWAEPFTLVGRLAYPLFAFLLAHNLMHFSASPKRYASWLLGFAILSQPIYRLALPDTMIQLNILFTLLAGLLLLLLLQRWQQQPTPQYTLLLLTATIATGFFGAFFDYAAPGIVLPMIWWLWLKHPRNPFIVAVLLLLLFTLNNLEADALAGVMALPLIMLMQRLPAFKLPRMPRLFFYGFYPLHLLALYLIAK